MKILLNNRTIPVGLCIVFIVLLQSCNKHTRYRVLTFFFTGVPPIYEEKKEEKVLEKPVTPEIAPQTVLYSHTPYVNRECYKCHKTDTVFRIPGEVKSKVSTFKKGRDMPGPLIIEAEKICMGCHTYKSPLNSDPNKLWIHTPTAEGNCSKCHNPHQSSLPFMLSKIDNVLCIECHYPGSIKQNKSHEDENAMCLSCHNPHVGKNKMLLKKDFIEKRQDIKTEIGIKRS